MVNSTQKDIVMNKWEHALNEPQINSLLVQDMLLEINHRHENLLMYVIRVKHKSCTQILKMVSMKGCRIQEKIVAQFYAPENKEKLEAYTKSLQEIVQNDLKAQEDILFIALAREAYIFFKQTKSEGHVLELYSSACNQVRKLHEELISIRRELEKNNERAPLLADHWKKAIYKVKPILCNAAMTMGNERRMDFLLKSLINIGPQPNDKCLKVTPLDVTFFKFKSNAVVDEKDLPDQYIFRI